MDSILLSAADKTLYSLGMESNVIQDAQITASSHKSTDPQYNARLNMARSGWCVENSDSNPWIQVDFQQPMVVSAISTQGHGWPGAVDMTYKYELQYREVGSTRFVHVKNTTSGTNMVRYCLENRKFSSVFNVTTSYH